MHKRNMDYQHDAMKHHHGDQEGLCSQNLVHLNDLLKKN